MNDRVKHVVVMADIHGDISPLEDGYQYFWHSKGALSAADLRAIADELDRRKEEWDKKVREDLGS